MKITIYFKDLKADYIFSNEDLKVGDQVFSITDDRIIDGEHTLTGLRLKNGMISDEKEYCTGFPNDPHTIIDLKHSDYKPYEVHTSHGYGPVEGYFKVLRVIYR